MSLNSPQFSTVLEQMSNIGEKVNIGHRKVTTNSWSSAPEIQVTCFEEEIRNDQVQETGLEKNSFEETKETNEKTKRKAIKTLALHQSREKGGNDSGCCSSDEYFFNHRNSALSSGDQTIDVGSRSDTKTYGVKSANGSLVSNSPRGEKKKTIQRNFNSSKIDANADTGVQPKANDKDTTPRPSSKSLAISSISDVNRNSSASRRRYTICSVPGGNVENCEYNLEPNNRRRSVADINMRNSRAVKENSKINHKRIDLKFDTNTAKSHVQLTRVAQILGSNQNGAQASDEMFTSGEDSLTINKNDCQPNNCSLMDVRFPVKLPSEIITRTQKLSKNQSLSVLKEVGVISSTDPGQKMRIKSAYVRNISNSLSVEVKENHLPLRPRPHSDPRPQPRRSVRSRKQKPWTKNTQLTVDWRSSVCKSDSEMGKFSPGGDENETTKSNGVLNPPQSRKSVDIWKEGDARKLASEAEVNDIKSNMSIVGQSQGLRNVTSPRQQQSLEISGHASPVSPREERKIYLGAAKPIARIRNKVQSRSHLQTTSQIIIDQAEKELNKCNERLPHIPMEQVMKRWQTDRKHWNMVYSTVVNSALENNGCKTNIETLRGCRYIRESVVTKTKKKTNQLNRM